MRRAAVIIPEEDSLVLSNLSPGPAQKRLAFALALSILGVSVLVISGLFSNIRLGQVDAFVPAYASAMIVSDAITGILLFTQFSILRTRAILVIASGYLFTALILIPWALAFPGAFSPRGLIGGLQSTSGLYFFWHAGFAAFVLGYVILKDADPRKRFSQGSVRATISLSVALTVAIVTAVAFLCIVGEALLPRVTSDTLRFTSLWPYVVGAPVGLVSIATIIVLWVRRRTVLDLWLMVVMLTFAVDPLLSYYPLPSRFSVGWYTVRIFGLLSSSLVLLVLLYEITGLYAQVLGAVRAQRREREVRLMTGDAVAATIAHQVKQPLATMITRADTGLRWLDRSIPDVDKAKAEFKQIAANGHRAGAVIDSIRANFMKNAPIRASLDVNELIEDTLVVLREDLQKHRILLTPRANAEVPQVMGDRIQLQQVLLNLIHNAIDSMASGDGLRVLSLGSTVGDDGDVVVSVADTGAGISLQDAQRLFDPLFTTKPRGMGMGLAICRSIIEAHDGRLLVGPNTPSGAVFQFALRPAQ
jgi:signal transduction histidine kinase